MEITATEDQQREKQCNSMHKDTYDTYDASTGLLIHTSGGLDDLRTPHVTSAFYFEALLILFYFSATRSTSRVSSTFMI
jgi:hypothetical protein